MPTNFTDVGDFHRKFGLHASDHGDAGPVEVPEELYLFRLKFLQEELDEFRDSWEHGDVAGLADALIDLVYVAMGTAHLFGFPWEALWNEVQGANMSKVRATPEAMGPRQNSSHDVIKGPNFTPPDINGVLEQYGWPVRSV